MSEHKSGEEAPEAKDIGYQFDQPMSSEEQTKYQARQKSRAMIMAVMLIGLCVLFYLITIVKIGVWG